SALISHTMNQEAIYIFLMDNGSIHTVDAGFLKRSITVLQEELQSALNVPIANQVLLASGGVYMQGSNLVEQYHVGLDPGNPIFLFNVDSIRSDRAPVASTLAAKHSDICDRVRVSVAQQAATAECLRQRVALAEELASLGQQECNQAQWLVRDQHLLHQGWLASLANLDELMQRGRPEHDEFLTKAREFLDKKTEIKATLDNFESCLNLLGRVPVHPGLLSQHHQPQQPRRGSSSFRPRRASSPAGREVAEDDKKGDGKATVKEEEEDATAADDDALSTPPTPTSKTDPAGVDDEVLVVQDDDSTADAASSPAAAPAPAPPRPAGSTGWCGSSSEVCLLAWISSQDGGSGEGAAEDSGSGLHRLRDALDQGFRSVQSVAVDQLNEEFRKCVARSSDISYREVRGLEDRLLELNRLADDALQLAAGQAESARGFRANQERWLSLRGDPSLLADLCASHRSQLEAMAKQHDALRDKRLRILRSKEEFTINLHRRLKWLSKIQLDYSHNKYRVNLMKTQVQRSLRAHELLQQAERSPYLYARALAEIVRRRSFAKKYNEWTRSLSSDSSKLHDRERTVRKELAHTLRSHLLRSLFTSLAYRSLSFATKPPEDLDTGLPRVTRSDLEALAVRVPELRPHLILRENVPAEEVFRKFRRLAEVAAASRQLPRRHSVGLGGPPDFVDYPDVDSADATRALADADSSTGVIRPRSCGSVEFLIGPCSLRTGAQHQQHPQPPPIHESHSAVDFASTSPGVGARGGYSRPISFPASRLLCGLGESRRSRVLSVDTFDSGSQNFLCEEDFADPLLLVQPRTTAEDASQPVDIPVRRRVRTITEGSSASLSSLPVTLNISPGGEDFYTCPDFSKAAAPAGQLVPGSSSSASMSGDTPRSPLYFGRYCVGQTPPPQQQQQQDCVNCANLRRSVTDCATSAGRIIAELREDLADTRRRLADATGEFGRWTADLNSWLAGAEASVRREQEAKLAELKDEVSTVTRELHEYADQLSVANADYDRAVADHQDQLQRQQDQAAAELDALNRRLLVEHELEQENMRSELTSRLRDLEEENNRQRYYLEEAQRKLEAAVNERNKATNNDQVWRDRLERAKAESGQLVEKLKYSNRLETENALQDQRLRHEQELEELRRENQELSGALAELRSASPTPAETKDAKIRELEQRLADLNRQMLRDHELMRRLHQRASGSGGDSQSPLSTSPVVPSRLAQQSAAAASAAVTTSGHADLQLHGQQLSQQLQQSTSVAVTSVYVSTEPSEQSSASAAHSLSGAPDRNVCLCHCGFRKGDSVLLYYSHAHEQWTLYCSDGGLYFVKDSTLGTLGLPAHLPVGHSQPIMLAEFQSKEHCQTRKFPNRFRLPMGTRFYRCHLRLHPLSNAQLFSSLSYSSSTPQLTSSSDQDIQ
ncbi:hypothetical protein BOX15_Mlig010823g1, partial [Macrostomum lignano]